MNVSGENQSRPAWDGNEASRCATFAEACAVDSGTYRLVVPEVAVPLRHLVLEDRRPAEHLPDDLADEPVVLVGVVAARGEDQVGIHAGVGGDRLLRRLAEERQEAVAEVADVDPLLGDALEEALRARPRLGGTLRDRGGEHEPGDGRVGTLVHEAADGAARADLRVVGVRARHEDPRTARRRQAERLRHGPHDGAIASPASLVAVPHWPTAARPG